jgi:hypothetical protein
MCVQYGSEEFASPLLVRNIRIGELLGASGIDMRINGPRSARVKLLGSR